MFNETRGGSRSPLTMTQTNHSRRSFLRVLGAAGAGAPILARAERLDAALPPRPDHLGFDPTSPASVRRLRDSYFLSPDLVYLNHASIGTVPRPVHEAHAGYLELCETHPSLYVWGGVWREVTEDTRAAAARLLKCRPDDLAITHNTTEGFSILAQGLELDSDDEVLFSSLNHAGAAVAWDELAPRRGFTVRRFDFPLERAPDLTVEEVVALHVDAIRPETRVLVIPHVDNMIGMTHPIREIALAARDRGVEFVFVDGAQSAGMISVDLGNAGVDAYAMSGHKWLQSPKGLGLFWASERLQAVVPRMWFKTGGDRVGMTARKYEDYSTRAWPAVVAFGDALDFQASIGVQEKERRYRALWALVHRRTTEDTRLHWGSPVDPALRSVIMAVGVRSRRAPELGPMLLERHGAVLRAFGGRLNTLRISPNLMTEDDALDRFLDVLTSLAE